MDHFISRNARSVLFGDRQCTATARDGSRCGRYAALYQNVCDHHGAKTPMALRAAKERVLMMMEPALDAIYRAVRNAPPCEHCGRSDADRDPVALNAAKTILDRAGLVASVGVQVSQEPRVPTWELYLTNDQLRIIASIISDAKQRMAAGEPRQDTLPTIEANAVLVESTDPEQGSSPVGAEPKE